MSQHQPTPAEQQDLPCDFLAFLQSRSAVAAEAAVDILGEWLVQYEPGPLALANAKQRVSARPRRSPGRSPTTYIAADAA